MRPKVSAVVPVLNGANFIDKAMGYLRSQTFRDFEIVLVVDTRSEDDTIAIAQSYSDRAKIVLEEGGGPLGISRNIGVDNSEGEFIWYMDIDDRPLPDLLERLTTIQEEYDADIVACNFIYSSDLRRDYDLSKYDFKVHVMTSDEAIDARSRERFPVTVWSKIYRRSMLVDNDIRFNDKFCEDIEYTYTTLRHARRVCYTEEPLYIYYQHPNSYCMNGAKSDQRGLSELTAYRNLERMFSDYASGMINRRGAITTIRSSGHMTYRTFLKYAKSQECREMLRRHCSDPVSLEAMWYRFSPSTYYLAERTFFKLVYYRDGRIYSDPTGLVGFTRLKTCARHSDHYVPEIVRPSDPMEITIGICAYNEERNIERTIRSVFTQRLDGAVLRDVFVVSSGSTDSTDTIVRGLMKEFDNLQLLPQASREGKNSAINLILETKTTDIVVLLNADNVFENELSLERLVQPLHDPKVGMVGGHPIPTNSDDSLPGFTVQLMWRTHHHVAMQYPKTGELIAFRDVGTRLPTDMQSDEDILRMRLEDRGYMTVYAPEATILNHGPDTVMDYIKQRTRVNIGELYMKDKFGYHLPTHNYRILLNAFLESLREMDFHPIRTISAMVLEMYPRLKARVHVRADRGDMNVWDQVATTKKL